MPQYIVVCEGRSELVYLQRLQSFLDAQTGPWDVPLRFIPKVPAAAGGGFYRNIINCYKDEHKQNKRHHFAIWVDHDIYFRQSSAEERRNSDRFLKHTGVPTFLFSFHNFEDFLVLHMDDATVQRWHAAFVSTGHSINPLHSEDYMPLFESVLPGYHKGDLSPDFITKESLLRLKINLANPLIPTPDDPRFRCFAQFLVRQIDTAFPALLVP
jgi:hypothetical protein